MNHERLLEFINREKEAIRARKNAEAEYLKANGIPIGAKVRILRKSSLLSDTGKIGIVSEKEYYFEEIRYTVGKITKSGKLHKSASIGCFYKESDLEIIKETK